MRPLRQNFAQILESSGKNIKKGRWLDSMLVVIILINVIAIVVESVQSIAIEYKTIFMWIEIVSVLIFTVEFLVRLWACVDKEKYKNSGDSHFKMRLKYLLSPLALIDLIAILPFYLMFFISIDLRFLRVIRLMRIFKLTRYSRAMQLLFQAFRQEAGPLSAAFFIMTMALIIASCGIYLIEHDVQPDKFGSIPQSMWWAMATLTTVGYGDAVPITALGRFFGGIITIISMGMVAIPTGLLASSFSEQLRKRRLEFSTQVNMYLKDGLLEKTEKQQLERLRIKLGLSKQEAKRIIKNKNVATSVKSYCPNCGTKL